MTHGVSLHLKLVTWRSHAGALQECGSIGDIPHVGPSDVYVFTCACRLQAHISTTYEAVSLLPYTSAQFV